MLINTRGIRIEYIDIDEKEQAQCGLLFFLKLIVYMYTTNT